MDLRSLIDKLDTIEQEKLLLESEELMERVGLRLSDIEQAVGRELDGNKRAAIIGDFARKFGYAGLFDPVSGKFVNKDGKFASFGAYQSEVEQLEDEGLIPNSAKTDALLGFMGKDEKAAKPKAFARADLMGAIDKADGLLDKALDGMLESKGIANSLLEEFGIDTRILEAITPEEHQFLKKTVKDAEPIKHKADANNLITRYNQVYVPARNRLIAKIKEVIATIKPAAKAVPAAPAAKDQRSGAATTKESLTFENKDILLEIELTPKGKQARAKIYQASWTGYLSPQQSQHNLNMIKKGYARYTVGDHVGQNVRDIFNAPTMGAMDKFQAWASSRNDPNTSYEKELAKLQGQTTAYNKSNQAGNLRNAVKAVTGYQMDKDNPFGNITPGDLIGTFAGGMGLWNAGVKVATKLGVPGVVGGLTTTLAAPLAVAQVGNGRQPNNQQPNDQQPNNGWQPGDNNQQSGNGMLLAGNQFAIMKMQRDLKAAGANLGTYGPDKDGVDGKIGKFTRDAMAKYPEIAKKHGFGGGVATQPDNQSDDGSYDRAEARRLSNYPADNTDTYQTDINTRVSPEQVQTMMAELGITGTEITPDQLLALSDKLGITDAAPVAESTDLDRILKLSGLEENAGAVASIFGAGERNVLRWAGETWRRSGNTWLSSSGKTKTAAKMDDLLQKQYPKGSKGGTKLPREYSRKNIQGQNANSAVDSMTRQSIAARTGNVAASSLDDVARTLPQAAKGVFTNLASKLSGLGGRFAQLLKNPKFWWLMAALAALGITIYTVASGNSDDNVDTQPDNGGGGGGGGNGGTNNGPAVVPPNAAQEEERKREEERQRQLGELNKLLNQLYGGWPTDAETAQTIQAAVAVGGTAPTGFTPGGNGSGVATQPANGGAYRSPIDAKSDAESQRMADQGLMSQGKVLNPAEKKTQ